MSSHAADLAHRLARNAEAVCRHYLSNGRREGRYWLVGDVANTPGRSLFVRLHGPDSGKGAAGKWTDAATGEHGDLLDLIALQSRPRPLARCPRRGARLPQPAASRPWRIDPARDLSGASRIARSRTPSLRHVAADFGHTRRSVSPPTRHHGFARKRRLRFHPRCYYRPDADAPTETWPALIAAVTDLDGRITGAHRTWLDPSGRDKAPIDTPRRAMGHLLGNGVRFGVAHDVMAAGEGIETMLSLRSILPTLPMVAALSANHLAAILFPAALRRLYVARDSDPAGDAAVATLNDRAAAAGIEALTLSPALGDFNEDLLRLGAERTSGSTARPTRPGGRGPLHGLGDGRDGMMCPALRAADRIGS